MKKLKNEKGITLVALVVTIIILAGVTISIVLGENGLIAKSKRGAENYQTATIDELKLLTDINSFLDGEIDKISSGSGSTTQPIETKTLSSISITSQPTKKVIH